MSSTGNPALPPAKPEAMALLTETAPTGRADFIEDSVRVARILNGTGFPIDEDRLRKKAGDIFDRGSSPAGMTRQLAAIIASGSRKEALKSVTVPTLVIHGDADPLVSVEAGIDTANAIPEAELLIIRGMGHGLPPSLWPQVVAAIVRHAI